MIVKKRAKSIRAGDTLDTSAGAVEVLSVGTDPFNPRAVVLSVALGERRFEVGAFSPGQVLNVVR